MTGSRLLLKTFAAPPCCPRPEVVNRPLDKLSAAMPQTCIHLLGLEMSRIGVPSDHHLCASWLHCTYSYSFRSPRTEALGSTGVLNEMPLLFDSIS